MKKILSALILTGLFVSANAQVVEKYGPGFVSENPVKDKIDIKECGRTVHVASVEDEKVVVRRFYRGKWEQFDETPIDGIFKLKALEIFPYRATPYVFCFYDSKMSVIRSIDDKWEYVGEEIFGEGSVHNPEFSVIGEKPFVIYEDKDYEMLRMFSLLDESWYDVDIIEMEGLKSYKLASNARGDLFMALLHDDGVTIKKVDQEVEDMNEWADLTKKIKLDGVNRIDDFEFKENTAYFTYSNESGSPVIMTLMDGSKKWEVVEELEEPIEFGEKDYNLNISEYYFFTSLSAGSLPQFLKNNKKGNWGDVTSLSDKKAKAIASDEYRNVIYVAYVDNATSKLMVKKIEKGELDE